MAEEELTQFEKLIKSGIELLNSEKLPESEEKLAEALKIAETPDQRFQAIRSLLNLAAKYIKLQDTVQPRTLYFYLQTVDVEERTRVMELLASLYKQHEDLANAERMYVEIYDLRVQSLGPNHPDTMGVLQTAAMLVQMQGKSPEGLYAKAYNATKQAAVEERERSPHNHTEEIPIIRAGSRTLTDMQAISHLLTATSKLPRMDRPKPVEQDKKSEVADNKADDEHLSEFKDSAMADTELLDAQLYLDEQLDSNKAEDKSSQTQELQVQESFAPDDAGASTDAAASSLSASDAARKLLAVAAELAEAAIALAEHAALLANKGLELAGSTNSTTDIESLQKETEKAMLCITSAKDKYESAQTQLSKVESALSKSYNESTEHSDADQQKTSVQEKEDSSQTDSSGSATNAPDEIKLTPSGQPFPAGLRLAAVPQKITIADIQAAAAAAAAAQSEKEALLEARANISPEALAKIKTTSSSPLSMIDDMMQGSSAVEQERSLSLAPDVQPEIVTKNLLLEPGWQQIINQWEVIFTSLKIRIADIFQQQMPVPYNEVLKKNQELFEKAYPIIKQIDFRFVFEEHDQLEEEIRTDVDIANAFKRVYAAWDGSARFSPHEITATYAWLKRCVTLGAFHQDTLRSLFRLGIIMTEQSRPLPKTEPDLGLKLMRFVRAASDNHPKFKVLDRIRNATILARKLLHDKQPEEALSLFNIAYRAAKTCDDVSPAEMTDLLKNLAMCHETMGNYQGATDLFERIRRVQEAMSRNSEDLCETTIHLLTNYRILNNEQAATACQQRILCELDWLEKPSAMKIFAATKCEEMAQMDLAEQLCKDVLAQSDGDESSASKALVLLARIYEKTGRAKEADRIKIVLSRTGK